jgi:hypothetical protein
MQSLMVAVERSFLSDDVNIPYHQEAINSAKVYCVELRGYLNSLKLSAQIYTILDYDCIFETLHHTNVRKRKSD